MKRKQEIIDFLIDNDNATFIGEKNIVIDMLFELSKEEVTLSTGRYNPDEKFLMLSRLGNTVIVEAIIDYTGDVYYVDSKEVMATKGVVEFLIGRERLNRVVDECEYFKII